MISGAELLGRIRSRWGADAREGYRFPFTCIDIVSKDFASQNEAEREARLAKSLEVSESELRAASARLFFRITPLAPDERRPTPSVGHFWVRTLAEPAGELRPAVNQAVRVIHFYGFKGGQARSTVLSFLARCLAKDGWRVLCLDLDAEAPSLHLMFGVEAASVASTMVGIRAGLAPAPVNAWVPPAGPGSVSLLAFRPSSSNYDIDAAALAMEASVFPMVAEQLVDSLRPIFGKYDIVLIDHRSGMAPTVPAWTASLAGPVVACVRLDSQWQGAGVVMESLWRQAGNNPGAIVSFSFDPDPLSPHFAYYSQQRAVLLDHLAAAMTGDGDEQDDLSGEDVADHWLLWRFDSAFRKLPLPEPGSESRESSEAIRELRRLLDVERPPSTVRDVAMLHPSGARDEGDLIVTQAIRLLTAPNPPYVFVLGRKGTGKSRIARELVQRGKATPLVVADDFKVDDMGGGITAASLRDSVPEDATLASRFWWRMLRTAVENPAARPSDYQRAVRQDSLSPADHLDALREHAEKAATRRIFVLDGLETLFRRDQTYAYLSALLRMVGTIEGEAVLDTAFGFRIFLRTDLSRLGFENFEQQSHGKRLDLEWDQQTILNFVLSRLPEHRWFNEHFPEVIEAIRLRSTDIMAGAVRKEEAFAILGRIFPDRVGRLNIRMDTFLATYFTDDPKGLNSYYPRLFDGFIRHIAEGQAPAGEPKIVDGRVSQSLIYKSHEVATVGFLDQVKHELRWMLPEDIEVDRLLSAMKGQRTPFVVTEFVSEVAQRATLAPERVRDALQRMFDIGMFEDREGFAGQWRVGRLFKSSLNMIYDRKRRPDEA